MHSHLCRDPTQSSKARECSVLVGACWRRLKLRLSQQLSEPKQVEDLRRDTLKSTTKSYRVTIDDGGRHVARTRLVGSARVFARLVLCCVPVVASLSSIFSQEAELKKRRTWGMPDVKWRSSKSCLSLGRRRRRHCHRRRRRYRYRRHHCDVGEANVVNYISSMRFVIL